MLSRYTLFLGRRRLDRRSEDADAPSYMDRISAGLGTVLLAIFVFHVLDAVCTLEHLSRGGRELNPLMDHLIQQSPSLFMAIKLTAAGVGLLFLGLHQNFPVVRPAIASLFVLFGGLVFYHVILLAA